MKVNIYETIEVSDEQRVQIAREIDGDSAKKRQATRDEIKDFVWTEGRNWAQALSPKEQDPEDNGDDGDDEDLLGVDDDEDLIG